MPIPPLEADGLLPEGIHDCSLEEVHESFGRFRGSDRRPRLYKNLERLVRELRRFRIRIALVIDGSFVTSEPRPNDIDLLLVLPAEWDFEAELPPDTYSLLSKRHVKKRFGFDILIACEESPEYETYLLFFQGIRGDPDQGKGLLRICL